MRLALTLTSLAGLRQSLLPLAVPCHHDLVEVARVAWSIGLVARIVPFASCLTRAQAGQILLARRGIASMLCLGVREGRSGALEAHAWLICDGRVVLGGEGGRVASLRQLAELGPVR